jgi:UDP-N-acetylmuramyl tripeptide synthase
LQSKAKLFTDYESSIKVLDYKNALLPYLPMIVTTYSPQQLNNCSLKTHLQSKNIQLAQKILSKAEISSPMNLDNWVESSLIKGRFEEFFWSKNRTVIVDFAHTPEALKYLLSGLSHIAFTHRWLIFGCGGQRDRSKRFEMVKVAKQYTDQIIITSDNPRHEPFEQIVADMCSAISRHDLIIIEDRSAAIQYAHDHAPHGSLIIIAGKGHEESQVIGSRAIQYSDLKEAGQYAE